MYRRISPILFALLLVPYFFAHGFYLRFISFPLLLINRRIGARANNALIRFWGVNFLRIGAALNGVRLEVTGFRPEPGKPYLVLSNHQSIIDIVVLFWLFRKSHIKFVMKKELKWGIPNVSPATRFARFAFLDRKAGAKPAENVLAKFAAAVKEEETGCVIYPEGTRSRDGQLRNFKAAGVALLAEQLDYEVLVVTLDGTWRAATPSDIYHNLPGMKIQIHVEPPRPVEPFREDSRAALDDVRETMRMRLAAFRDERAESPHAVAS